MEILKSHYGKWPMAGCTHDDDDSTHEPNCDSYSCRYDSLCFSDYSTPERKDDNDAPAKRNDCSDAG